MITLKVQGLLYILSLSIKKGSRRAPKSCKIPYSTTMVIKPCSLYQSIIGQGNIFLPESSDFLCPECQKGNLIYRDHCKRIIRYEGGRSEWIHIPRHQCNNERCRRVHRMLPDCILPYKHYSEETISGVLDGIVIPSDSDSEDYPSEETMNRWHHWFMMNTFNIDGHLKSVAFRELDFAEELLKSGISLLDHLRSSITDGWLRIVIRYIYNSGGKLPAFY